MIERTIEKIASALTFVALISLFLMMLQTVADVLATNFFRSPIAGNLEFISFYHMVLVVFLPLAFVDLRQEHITVDLFYLTLPEWLQRVVLVIGYLASAAFFAILTCRTGQDAWRSYQIDEVTMAAVYVTIWPAKTALPVGFAGILATSLLHAVKAFQGRPIVPQQIGAEENNASEAAR